MPLTYAAWAKRPFDAICSMRPAPRGCRDTRMPNGCAARMTLRAQQRLLHALWPLLAGASAVRHLLVFAQENQSRSSAFWRDTEAQH
jgi:hypothetical protein